MSQIDPQVAAFITAITEASARHPGLDALPMPEQRQILAEIRREWALGGPVMAEQVDLKVGTPVTPVRIYRPTAVEHAVPTMIYLHGGGWSVFSVQTHDRLMREYAARAGVAVVGVDYSLAPEAKFPTALHEIAGVVRWLQGAGATHGLDSGRLFIGGDSAGANLAVATQLLLAREGGAPFLGMVLNYGVYGDCATPSWRKFDGPPYMLGADEMARFWGNYLRDDSDRFNALAVPLRADVAGLPPTFMTIAEYDILLDENLAMARALERAGVPVKAVRYPGTTHSFLEAMSVAEISNIAIADAAEWLRQCLRHI